MMMRSETSLSRYPSLRRWFVLFSRPCLSAFLFLIPASRFFTAHVSTFSSRFLTGESLCPAVGSARSCTLRVLRATFISRARKPRILSFNLTTREGQGSGTKGPLCGRMYRLVACFRSGRLNFASALFALSFQRRGVNPANRDDCINSHRWAASDIRNNPAYVRCFLLATHIMLRH